MVRFLIKRPIAVFMAVLALMILGCVTFVTLPISLLPNIAIPNITVQINEQNTSARELENTIVTPLRRQLMQISNLDEIRSETRDGSAIISLKMDYGVNTDLAFIEVNEKIDAAMNLLPKSANRPKAIKASATDIPILYLQMTSRSDDHDDFVNMSNIADNIVRRRLEQLPQVAMVDITGIPKRVLRITPDLDHMAQIGVTIDEIESALTASNVEPGSMRVKDGYYEYNIHVTNLLRTPEDVRHLKIKIEDRIYELGDFADVNITTKDEDGFSTFNNQRAVTLAIIKHDKESIADLNNAIERTIDYFNTRYPDIQFTQTRSQTKLLDYTISNLEQNIILGLILVIVVCSLFMGGMRSSMIIGISIIAGVIITFLLFYLFNVSINIISLSGLILAIGMMIDNSVIVTENIEQNRQRGLTLARSCIKGTNEMVTPMLSSSLTTIAVFAPLIFLSGIAGAIFSDQAFSITAGLTASFAIGITLLPVLYYVISRKQHLSKGISKKPKVLVSLYDKIIDFCFKYKWTFIIVSILTIPLCILFFNIIDKERMPHLDSNETIVNIDWNENINLEENRSRVQWLCDSTSFLNSAYIGSQDYMLSANTNLTSTEAELYVQTESSQQIPKLQNRILEKARTIYPQATINFSKPENIFEKIFSSDEANLEAQLRPIGSATTDIDGIVAVQQDIVRQTGEPLSTLALRDQINIVIDREKLVLYNVDITEVQRTLRTAFKGNTISTLHSNSEYTPIEISGREQTIQEIINHTFVKSIADKDGVKTDIPIRNLVRLTQDHDLKTITSGSAGEYIPIKFNCKGSESTIIQKIRNMLSSNNNYDIDFAGAYFSNSKMINELIVVLIISIALMYLILCAQFESFIQPLIILLEIPIDIAFALLALIICGQSLNLMSAIGIIVTCGIVINDSILKLDTINTLRKSGLPLMEAIHTAGRRRLIAIIMTSLTTIFAMIPILFTSDMGSELQQPLAIAMIGAMTIGTLVSIFIIPIFYWLIYRKHEI
jgi:multidrug efflux pump subunit AcrB